MEDRRKWRHDKPGYLRIIGGQWRSRRILIPAGTPVRPTPDRVRETLFNWLAPHLFGAVCLDLYAGSGALGFEALSRGASKVVFVESDARLKAAIEANVRELCGDAGTAVEVYGATAEQYLSAKSSDTAKFHIAFLDPPYDLPLADIFERLRPHMHHNGKVYIERASADRLPELTNAEWLKLGSAGAVRFALASLADGSE